MSLEQPRHVCVYVCLHLCVHTYCSEPKYVQSSQSQQCSVGLSVSQPQLSHTGVGAVSYRTHTRPVWEAGRLTHLTLLLLEASGTGPAQEYYGSRAEFDQLPLPRYPEQPHLDPHIDV